MKYLIMKYSCKQWQLSNGKLNKRTHSTRNKDIQIMSPKVVAGYVMHKYKCSPYLAKKIAKQLTNDGK